MEKANIYPGIANAKIKAQLKNFESGNSQNEMKYAEVTPNTKVKNNTKINIINELFMQSKRNVFFNNIK